MDQWTPYTAQAGLVSHSVVGNVQRYSRLWSPQLRNHRDLLVYLPPSFERGGGPYPVIYMHDGQNLFDSMTSYCGEWQVDETMESLSTEGLEAIVVGIPNMGTARIREYAPFSDPRFGMAQGDRYLAFIVESIKPLIDSSFPALTDRVHTGLIGSSMGGLISLYGLCRFPDIFGFAGAMSPSLWFAGGAITLYAARALPTGGRLYLDAGTAEAGPRGGTAHARRFCRDVRRLHRIALKQGYRDGQTVHYVEERGAPHHESAWARRLPHALRFLLAESVAKRIARAG